MSLRPDAESGPGPSEAAVWTSGPLGRPRGLAAFRRPCIARSGPDSDGPSLSINVAAEAALAVAGPAAAWLRVHPRRGALLPPGAAAATSLSPGPGLAEWRQWTRFWRAW